VEIQAAVVTFRGAAFRPEMIRLDEPRADEVRVAVRAAGICHTDLVLADLDAPGAHPAVFGHEGAGVVEVVGSAVHGIAPGDHVLMSYDSCGFCGTCRGGRPFYCDHFGRLNFAGQRQDGSTALSRADGEAVRSHFFGQSSHANYANVRARTLVPLPHDVPFELAAPLACGIQTGAGAVLNTLRAKPQSHLAIAGLGGVGLGAVMAAALAGVGRVIAIDPVAVRRSLALDLGAHIALDPAAASFGEDLAAAAGALDHAFDTSGRQDTVTACFNALAAGGELVTVAAPNPPTWSFNALRLLDGRRVRGIVMGEAIPQNFLPYLIEQWHAGRLPVEKIVTTFPLDHVESAVAAMRNHDVIKPVLTCP